MSRMNSFRLLCFVGLWLACAVTYAQPQQLSKPVSVDKIIVRVDNYILLKSELEMNYQSAVAQGQARGPQDKCFILEQLVMNKILMAKAEIDSIMVDDRMVSVELDRRMDYFVQQAGGEEKLEKGLGKKLNVLKEEMREQVKEQLTIQKVQKTVTESLKVTPSQVRRFFGRIPTDSLPFFPDEVQAGQIVIHAKVSESEKERARARLIEYKKQILAGADFAELARKNSEDLGSAVRGGDLGWHGRGELVPEFEATALKTDVGVIADPIESDFGFHLIQVMERRGNRFRARHILISPKANESDIRRTEALLDSVRGLLVSGKVTFEQAVKDFSDDKGTKSNNGWFKDEGSGELFMDMQQLPDPVLFMELGGMKNGVYSKVMRYRTRDGKNAVRLLYRKDFRPAHQAELQRDWQKISNAALEEERAKALDRWVRSAKDQVFIEIDPEYNDCNILGNL